MNFVRKALLPTAGVAAIVLIVSLASPRAVHAIAAALVQVVNTPANAVPTMLAPAASQLYQSSCTGQSGGYANAFCLLDPVPAKQTLFVEAVNMIAYAESGNSPIQPYFSAAGNFDWSKPGNHFIPLFAQGSGLWIGNLAGRVYSSATVRPGCYVYFASNSTGGTVICQVSGYLAPAQ